MADWSVCHSRRMSSVKDTITASPTVPPLHSEHFKPCHEKDLAYCLNGGECFVIETLSGPHKHCKAACAYPRVEKLFQGCSPDNASLQTETIGICQSSSLWACWPYVESSICQEMSRCTVGLPDVQVVSLLLRGEKKKKSSWMSDGVSEGGGDKCCTADWLMEIQRADRSALQMERGAGRKSAELALICLINQTIATATQQSVRKSRVETTGQTCLPKHSSELTYMKGETTAQPNSPLTVHDNALKDAI
ncbi:Pro-neuregulin-3, membrane-bound isoform [Collichthys lucidus]|uniref:Pro-neuregulin-3, membrane-bound isoform n=1 Tax=Collichthys lucidus TaxID=240159 RepID=A0A4V6ARX2_COLLU|nr:Pro-neuregulin-3, membrane-bound isoform [Collichthys lucidus]